MGLSSLKRRQHSQHNQVEMERIFIFLLTRTKGRGKSSFSCLRGGRELKVEPHHVWMYHLSRLCFYLFGWLHDWGLLTFSTFFRLRILLITRSFNIFEYSTCQLMFKTWSSSLKTKWTAFAHWILFRHNFTINRMSSVFWGCDYIHSLPLSIPVNPSETISRTLP